MNIGSRVLVTGASGFTGPYMASVLRSKGCYVIAGGHGNMPAEQDFDEWVQLDLTDSKLVEKTLAKLKPDYVVHLAGISFVGHADMNAFYKVNVLGTENLLSALDSLPAGVLKGVLLASSANVYGAPEGGEEISEEQLPNPINHYAISKLAMEFVAKKFMVRLPVVVARPFNYIGFGQRESFVIPKIVSAHAAGLTSVELGSIDVSRDFTSVKDTVVAYSELLFEPACYGEIFNVCSSKALSLSEVLSLMTEKAGYEIEVIANPDFIRKHEIKVLRGSNLKIRNAIGWEPKVRIKDALSEMFEKYQAQSSS